MDFVALGDQFLDVYGLLAVFIIMLVKEIGVPVPIPSDLIMLGAAARAAQGKFPFVAAFGAILVPMIIGGLVQYAIAKGPARRAIYRLGRLIGLTAERLDRAMETVRKGGPVAVAVGLTTPGVRIAITPASGLAELSLGAFLPGLVVGSTAFLALHFAIGYMGGLALALLNLPLPVLAGLVVVVLAIGVIGWLVIRARHKRNRAASLTLGESYAEWADASCPACIAIALARQELDKKPLVTYEASK